MLKVGNYPIQSKVTVLLPYLLFLILSLSNHIIFAQNEQSALKNTLSKHFTKVGGLENWRNIKTIYKEAIINNHNQEKWLFREYTLVGEISRQDIIKPDSSMQSIIFVPDNEAVELHFKHYKDHKPILKRRTNGLLSRNFGTYKYLLYSQLLAVPHDKHHFLDYEELVESDSMILIKTKTVQPFIVFLPTIGIVHEFYFYKKTALLDRVIIDMQNSYMPMRTQYLLSNYQKINNLLIPMTVEEIENGLTMKIIDYRKIIFNQNIDKAIFLTD